MKPKNCIILFYLGAFCIVCGCSRIEIPTPTISTDDVTNITEMSAVAGGVISSDNGSVISEYGVCWSTHKSPTKEDNTTKVVENGPSDFLCKLEGLTPLTTYFVRAYATNAGGTSYGEEKSFTTKAFELTTIPPYFITATSATSGATVLFDSDRPAALVRGVCWNKFPNPTISNYKTIDGSGKGSFSSTMTGLEPFTTYFVRAYLTDSAGTTYGNEVQFTTQNGVIGIVTDAVTNVKSTEATFSATITGDGGSYLLDRGFCWSKFPKPTIADNKISYGQRTGTYSKLVVDLSSNTTYYVRAYATNGIGTVYGNEISFVTLAGVPKACFDYSNALGYKISFTNCSDYPTSCLWDFGDGTTSTEKDPTHVYTRGGTYNVKLVVSNDGLTDFITKAVVSTDIVNIENTPVGWYSNLSLFGKYIDVDGDGKNDFFVYGDSHTGPSQSYSETSIIPLGNYGIVCDSINVNFWNSNNNPANYTARVHIPKRFLLGNTILDSEETTTTKISFSASYNSYFYKYSFNSWNMDEVSYLGYINKTGSSTKLGWIKLKMYGSISLYSLKLPIIGSSLLIEN